MWRNVQRWRGVALIGIAVVATIWLSLGNQLVLYIHPRYIVFTVIMGVIALALVVASFVVRTHPEDEERPSPLSMIALGLAGVIALAMVVIPPATLTSATASQRDINSTTLGAQTQSVSEADAASVATFKTFTVVDWASLLRQTSDLSFYQGKPVDVVGFITADPDDPNMFYVSRFVVTCCAVDAQPTGIPVFLANWQDTYAVDDWIEASGQFGTNPSTSSKQSVALKPDAVTKVDQPSEPYLY
jgi:uncharacterized repeat protein (TIGR03943 family)